MREGRFSSPAAEVAQRYSESVSFDRRSTTMTLPGRSHMPRLSPAPGFSPPMNLR